MAEPYFQFRKFRVFHQKSAFKVGTDAVLLGAWAPVEPKMRVLDIGTGCGIIALFMAQRGASTVDAIDIHEPSIKEAALNFMHSPFGGLRATQADLAQWRAPHNRQFDLIVSNPPYFSNSTPAAARAKHAARHTDSLAPALLFENAKSMLRPEGILALIFPEREEPVFSLAASHAGLYPERVCRVIPQPGSPSNRLLACFTLKKSETIISELQIAQQNRAYTADYKQLVQPYLLRI